LEVRDRTPRRSRRQEARIERCRERVLQDVTFFSPCGRRWRAQSARRMRGLYPRVQLAVECADRDPSPRLRFAKPPLSRKGRGEMLAKGPTWLTSHKKIRAFTVD